MRNYLYLLAAIILLAGCGSTKDLKQKNQSLNDQLSELKARAGQLSTDNETFRTKIKNLESSNKELNSKLSKCDTELERLSAIYDAYSTKIRKMKAELESSFPNNLNDNNFMIVEEDGRLIIRLPNRILYKSGSAEFNSDALLVIQKLSKVFKANQGLNILVEGHTDDIPLRAGSAYADNWDLSLARAVKVVRQLETYGVHPERLTAAGRAFFAPLDKTVSEEARAKNRRTEIIIRPKIAEIIKALSEIN